MQKSSTVLLYILLPKEVSSKLLLYRKYNTSLIKGYYGQGTINWLCDFTETYIDPAETRVAQLARDISHHMPACQLQVMGLQKINHVTPMKW